jgi:acetoacetate decarboxylase
MKGWTLPQTDTGGSSLVSPPPWRYSGQIIAVEAAFDPHVAARLAPADFEADPHGAGAVIFADWSSSCDNDPRLLAEPGVGQYREAFVVLYYTWRGRAVARAPYIWVDNDLSLVRGLIQGFPKRMGQIAMSRAVTFGRGGPRLTDGEIFHAQVAANGERRITASVTLDGENKAPPSYLPRPLIHTRLWPSLARPEPAVLEHQEAVVADAEVGPLFSGAATLSFGVSALDELGELAPVKVGRGFVHDMAFAVLGGVETPMLG